MRLIALHTIVAHSTDYRAGRPAFRDPNGVDHPAQPQQGTSGRHFAPGEEFESADWAISDTEAAALISSGAAKRKTREVADDGSPQSQNRVPRPPASGATTAPDPNRVAARSMAGTDPLDILEEFRDDGSGDETSKPSGKELMDALKGAIGGLNPKKTSLFTSDGKPTVEALKDALGYDVTAAERDAAWAEVSAEQK